MQLSRLQSRRALGVSRSRNMAQLWVIDAVGDVEHANRQGELLRSGLFTDHILVTAPSRRPFYRPPGNPVLVGSYTFGRYQSGIPTHRYGGPGFRIAISRRSIKAKDAIQLGVEPTATSNSCFRSELHSGSRPHPGRRQSQYSWAHMDPSAHSLAFRGGAEVPDEV